LFSAAHRGDPLAVIVWCLFEQTNRRDVAYIWLGEWWQELGTVNEAALIPR